MGRDSRILLASVVVTITVGIVAMLAIGALWFMARGRAVSVVAVGYLLLGSAAWSMPFTVPGGLVGAMLMIRTARRQPPIHSLVEWLVHGTVWGTLCGALCLGLPLALVSPRAVAGGPAALVGGLAGAVAGTIVAAYCHRIMRREREWFDRIAGRSARASSPRDGRRDRIRRVAIVTAVAVGLVSAPPIAVQAGGHGPPLRSLSDWLWRGMAWGNVCGALCLGLPFGIWWHSLETAVVVVIGGGLLGSVAGALTGAYCHRALAGSAGGLRIPLRRGAPEEW